ncbi:MAG: hypothetical protein QOG29_519 [Gaiellaceae bacterium]|jgi:hypothetical protein|nr:hypothetical protein [Gaiellaceae bacterium]
MRKQAPKQSSRPWSRTLSDSDRIAAVLVPLAANAATEGKKVIIAMLVVGLVFVSVIAVGELAHHIRSRRHR